MTKNLSHPLLIHLPPLRQLWDGPTATGTDKRVVETIEHKPKITVTPNTPMVDAPSSCLYRFWLNARTWDLNHPIGWLTNWGGLNSEIWWLQVPSSLPDEGPYLTQHDRPLLGDFSRDLQSPTDGY